MTNIAPLQASTVIEKALAKGLEVQFYTAESDPTGNAPAPYAIRVYKPSPSAGETEMTATGETLMEAFTDLATATDADIDSVGMPFADKETQVS